MLKHWDVAAFGPSPHAEDSYYLIRRHDSLIHREQSQDACHGSDEGKQRLGEPILALIENYTSIVLEMDEMTLHSLRK